MEPVLGDRHSAARKRLAASLKPGWPCSRPSGQVGYPSHGGGRSVTSLHLARFGGLPSSRMSSSSERGSSGSSSELSSSSFGRAKLPEKTRRPEAPDLAGVATGRERAIELVKREPKWLRTECLCVC